MANRALSPRPTVQTIIKKLRKANPDARLALEFSNPLELLVATILAAQSSDERVNKVTATLFRKYKSCEDYLKLSPRQLQKEILPTGFFRNKQKTIQRVCALLLEKHGGQVPQKMDELLELPGVGRKTANVVLSDAFGMKEGIVVDLHVKRVSFRLGLTTQKEADKIESELMGFVPKRQWIEFSHLLIAHGRTICRPKPLCEECVIEKLCPSSFLKTGKMPPIV